MNINYVAVGIAAVAQFVIGAIWYMPLFGDMWGKIHGFDKLNKKDQDDTQKKMMPLLGVQFAGTILTTVVLANLLVLLPDYSRYALALMVWLGFVVPIQVSAVMFGGTDPKWMAKKILIMAGGALSCLLVATAILTVM